MKILLIHDIYQQYGGENACALADQQLLEAHRDQVIVYTRDNREIRNYGIPEKLALPVNTIYSLRTRAEVTSLVAQHRPDVAYIHNFFPLLSSSLYHVLHSLGVPIVQVVHNYRFFCPNGLFFTQGHVCFRCKQGNYLHAVLHHCYRDSYPESAVAAAAIAFNRFTKASLKIDAYACVSAFVKQVFQDAGISAQRLFVKPNFLDSSKIAPNFAKGDYALFLGRLAAEKDLKTLIAAFEQLPDVPLKIVGTGPLEGEIGNYLARRQLRNIELLGFKAGADKWELLRNSAFLIVPSACHETFGGVVLEAYAAGKPVIVAHSGALPEVVEPDRTGLLFSPGNVDELVTAVRSLMESPARARQLGRNGRTLVEMKFGPDQNYAILSHILAEVAGSRSAKTLELHPSDALPRPPASDIVKDTLIRP